MQSNKTIVTAFFFSFFYPIFCIQSLRVSNFLNKCVVPKFITGDLVLFSYYCFLNQVN